MTIFTLKIVTGVDVASGTTYDVVEQTHDDASSALDAAIALAKFVDVFDDSDTRIARVSPDGGIDFVSVQR